MSMVPVRPCLVARVLDERFSMQRARSAQQAARVGGQTMTLARLALLCTLVFQSMLCAWHLLIRFRSEAPS